MTSSPNSPDFQFSRANHAPRRAQQSLAEAVLGITDRTDFNLSIQQARQALMGADPYAELSDAERHELNISSAIIEDMIGEDQVRFANVLTDWPNYSRLMGRYGTKMSGSGTALLIGSLTPLSSRAFHTLAPDEFGIDKTVVVDPVGSKFKARQGLVYASGLELPFPAESMDVVMTNQLLHMLRDPRSKRQSPRRNSRKLFSEIGRVLKPGGQVLMQEIPSGLSDKWSVGRHIRHVKKLASLVDKNMNRNGIKSLGMEPQEVFVDNDYLFDPERDFNRERYQLPTLTVYGRRVE